MSARRIHLLPRLGPRPLDSHKGTFGRALLVAGSPGMLGAAALAARGCLRAGCGLVSVAVPGSLSGPLTSLVPEATQLLLPERDSAEHDTELARRVATDLERRHEVLAIGPGLGTDASSRRVLELFLERFSGPQVLDADALNLVAEGAAIAPLPHRVWTPHPGEFLRLSGESPRGDEERVRAAGRFAAARGGVVVLKGHRTVVHDGERWFVNLTGNPGMATGGSGDVLTGLVAGLLAQGAGAFDAAVLGVHVHGLAGDLAARRLGAASVTAGDISRELPRALRRFAPRGGSERGR